MTFEETRVTLSSQWDSSKWTTYSSILIWLKYLAIDAAKEVFPTPGGPTSRSILPFVDLDNVDTAINSKILSLISSIPKWSSSSTVLATLKSLFSSEIIPYGILVIHSKYVLTMLLSELISSIFKYRSDSSLKSFFTWSGAVVPASFLVSYSIKASFPFFPSTAPLTILNISL